MIATSPHLARRRQRGFTLIELMVVVAIIAVLAGVMIGASPRPYTSNPRSISEQLVGTMNLAKLRAVGSRRWHRVEVTGPSAATPSSIILWQWSDTGMAVPSGTCNLGPPVSKCWRAIEKTKLPTNIVLYHATSTVYASAGTSVTQNASLDFNVDFKPDGSSTGGTVFVADKDSRQPYRVLIYHATGSSYAREYW